MGIRLLLNKDCLAETPTSLMINIMCRVAFLRNNSVAEATRSNKQICKPSVSRFSACVQIVRRTNSYQEKAWSFFLEWYNQYFMKSAAHTLCFRHSKSMAVRSLWQTKSHDETLSRWSLHLVCLSKWKTSWCYPLRFTETSRRRNGLSLLDLREWWTQTTRTPNAKLFKN